MKNKKELRWLLLMIIPFIIMLGIHMLTPITIAGSSQPFAATEYILHQIGQSELQVRSTNRASARATQSIIEKYAKIFNIFDGFAQSINYSNFLLNSSQINSAFQYSNQANNTSSPYSEFENKSMWFVRNVTSLQGLSPTYKDVYDRYLSRESYIRSFIQNPSNSTLAGFSLLFSTPNQSMFFGYPSKYNPDYLNIRSSAKGSFYPSVLQVFNTTNYTSFALVRQEQNISYLVICKRTNIDKGMIVPCIHLKTALLASQITNSFQMTEMNRTRIYLVTSFNQPTQPAKLNANDTKTQSSQITQVPQVAFGINFGQISTGANAFMNLTNTSVTNSSFLQVPSSAQDDYVIVRSRNYTTYLSAIDYCHNGSSTVLLRLITQNRLQANINIRAVNVLNSLKAMLIPSSILILAGSIVSGLILKCLLDSLDKQLFQLDNRCQFIVDGDINIEISEHDGTKDIRDVYDQVRIINRFHRYSTSSYFSGHPAQKLLKYNEVLQFFRGLDYDTGNTLQNIGDVTTYLEEWTKAISSYNQSISRGLRELKQKFNLTMEDVLKLKKQKKPLPQGYKELQILLIRRMFKLNYVYIKYIELRSAFAKTDVNEQSGEHRKRIDSISRQSFQNLRLLKICFYPDYSSYSQSIITLLFEAKQLANVGRFEQAWKMLDIVDNYNKIYAEEYSEMTQKLKEKGPKSKIIQKRNKLTPHSRLHPEVLKILKNYFQAKIISLQSESYDNWDKKVNLLLEALKTGYIFESVGFVVAIELRNALIALGIDTEKYECTKVFMQAVPYKTLYYGKITKEVEPELLRFPTSSVGLEREFVFVFDCAKNNVSDEIEYFQERANYIYEKLLKPSDRLSIIKFNLKTGIKVECSLILKELNEKSLQKEIQSAFKEPNQGKGSLEKIEEMLFRTVNRIKGLQSEKIIVIFFKSISYYSQLNRRRSKKKSDFLMEALTFEEEVEGQSMNDFGSHVLDALSTEGLRNCKLIFYCSKNDTISEFRTFFGLSQINRQLWDQDRRRNNVVYIVEEKHKSDIDRILSLKPQEAPDNHIFLL